MSFTLSARTRKIPKSSSIAHCVTSFKCNTRRMAVWQMLGTAWNSRMHWHFESCRSPIQTPSAHPIATNPLPSAVASGICKNTLFKKKPPNRHTERDRACHLSGEHAFLVPRWCCGAVMYRRDKESVQTQGLNFEDLTTIISHVFWGLNWNQPCSTPVQPFVDPLLRLV